ncbi:tetratricopeptide repeat protein, partial [Nocardia rhizosphaerihabitans]|uniref:tetratricopeptide repeat protein n=1 Tax=Nocardia rhizosphaerihabitans TaxID=1691570 RepID=UPI00366E50D1
MSAPSDRPHGAVDAEATGNSQQNNLGQGSFTVNNYGNARPVTRLSTILPPPELIGRTRELDGLLAQARLARATNRAFLVSTVRGMGGVGKTAFARAAAAELMADYPDACLEIELHGFTPGTEPRKPLDVLGEVLLDVGFDDASIPDSLQGRTSRWRAWLADRRVLLLLDNARDAEQIIPLLPGATAQCLTLVTSRNSLDNLPNTTKIALDVLPADEAVALLRQLAGSGSTPSPSYFGELARLCGHLPLALHPIGDLLRHGMPADELLDLMKSADRPYADVPDLERAVSAAFTVSYDVLPESGRILLHACAIHPGPNFDVCSVAALTEQKSARVHLGLIELVTHSILTRTADGRFAFHDLFLGFARRRTEAHLPADDIASLLDRLFVYLATTTTVATSAITDAEPDLSTLTQPTFRDAESARVWLDSATYELSRAADQALATGSAFASPLAHAVGWWFELDGRYGTAFDLYGASASYSTSSGDQASQARSTRRRAFTARIRGDHATAAKLYEQALQLYRELGDRFGEANTLRGQADTARIRGDHATATALYEQALQLYRELGNRLGTANTLRGQAATARKRGDHATATALYKQALQLYRELGNRLGTANTLKGQADIARIRGDHATATALYKQALQLYRELGDRLGTANSIIG